MVRDTSFPKILRRAIQLLAVLAIACSVFLLAIWYVTVYMPGENYTGGWAPQNQEETLLATALHRDVTILAGEIGPRNRQHYANLQKAAEYIENSIKQAGLSVTRQEIIVGDKLCVNLVTEIRGTTRPEEIVVVGAHYDTEEQSVTPGADDNASGVAGLLALMRRFNNHRSAKTLRLVAFVNEENPYSLTDQMGSLAYARQCQRRGENIVSMISLEMLGYYNFLGQTQLYPQPLAIFYPKTADFIAFTANYASRSLTHRLIASFRKHTLFSSLGATTLPQIEGIGNSDHWAFWQIGVPAVMVTDTAFFRNPHYHSPSDTPDTLNYAAMARVVIGLGHMVEDILL